MNEPSRRRRQIQLRSLTRREFLAAGGGALVLAGTGAAIGFRERRSAEGVTIDIFRSDDLLKLQVQSPDLVLVERSFLRGPAVRPKKQGTQPLISLSLPPQHLLEQATPEDTSGSQLPKRGTVKFL